MTTTEEQPECNQGRARQVRDGHLAPGQTSKQCEEMLRAPISKPPSLADCVVPRVPHVYHAVSGTRSPPDSVRMNAGFHLRNFSLNYHGDASAAAYVRMNCGFEAAKAYRCFVAPAYRADVRNL